METKVVDMGNHTWRIEERDPDHGSSVYSYLLEGNNKALLIDTGLGQINYKKIIESLTNKQLEVIVTHAHIDHIGGNHYFEKVWIHELDQDVYQLHTHGFRSYFPYYTFCDPKDNINWYSGEPKFELGERCISVIHVPGHTKGHIALLDHKNRWLFTGDNCCKEAVLLNVEYAERVSTFRQSMMKLLELGEHYDTTWPAHHSIPVSKEILKQFIEASDLLLDGEKSGEWSATAFGEAYVFPYKDISVVYNQID